MAREPGDRYPSAAALADELERWLADEPITARKENLNERFWRFVRRHRALSQGAVGSLILIAAVCATAAVIINSA